MDNVYGMTAAQRLALERVRDARKAYVARGPLYTPRRGERAALRSCVRKGLCRVFPNTQFLHEYVLTTIGRGVLAELP